MLLFNEYKKLPKETQKHSLALWIDEQLALTNLENVNQLTEYLAGNFPEQCVQKKLSKYLYKKSRGQPIKDDNYVLFLDEKLSGGASVLFNPLWTLLEYEELSTAEAVKFASYLPFDLQKRVLSNDRRKIKADERTIYKLAQQGSFDTLAAMSIIYLHIKPTLYAYSRLVINKEFTLFIFSLFMTKFKRYDVGYFLIHKLSLLFNLKKIAPYDTYARFTLWDNNESKSFSMPITLSLITSAKMLNACCAVSGHIVNKTIKLLSLAPSNEMKHQVISHINLQNLDELTWNFYLIEKGEELPLDAELWKLRDRLNI